MQAFLGLFWLVFTTSVLLLVSPTKTELSLVVSVAENKLVVSDVQGQKEETHLIPPGCRVVLDGKPVQLVELEKGDVVKFEANAGGTIHLVTAFRSDTMCEGVIVSLSEASLVMEEKDRDVEHALQVGPGATITLNEKAAKLRDLSKGDAVKVTLTRLGEVSVVAATRKKTEPASYIAGRLGWSEHSQAQSSAESFYKAYPTTEVERYEKATSG